MAEGNDGNDDNFSIEKEISMGSTGSVMSQWQTKLIEEKFTAVKQVIDFKIEVDEWKKRHEFLDQEKQKETLKNKEIRQKILETQRKKQKLMAHHAQLTEHRKEMAKQTHMMEMMAKNQFIEKQENHYRFISITSKKIDQIKVYSRAKSQKHIQEMEALAEKLKILETELARQNDLVLKTKENIAKIEEEKKTEIAENEDNQKKIQEARTQFKEILNIQAETEKIRATKEAGLNFLLQNRTEIDNIHVSNIELRNVIEEHENELQKQKQQLKNVEDEQKTCIELHDMITSSLKEFKNHEGFQRGYMHKFKEMFDEIDIKTSENHDLFVDLEKVAAAVQEDTENLKKLREHFNTIEDRIKPQENNLEELKKKEAENKVLLQKYQDEVREANEALKQEILKLQQKHSREEEEIDNLRNKRNTTAAELNMKLKIEKEKTRQVRERLRATLKQKEAVKSAKKVPIGFSSTQPLRKLANKSVGEKRSFTQHPSPKSFVPPSVMSSSFESIEKPKGQSSQPKTANNVDPKESMEIQESVESKATSGGSSDTLMSGENRRVQRKQSIPVYITPKKEAFKIPESMMNVGSSSEDSIIAEKRRNQRQLPSAAPEYLKEMKTTPKPAEPKNKAFNIPVNIAKRFNQRQPRPVNAPVYLTELKKKPDPLIDAEGAFSDDDDESSFNITFNTDIEDLLDNSRIGK